MAKVYFGDLHNHCSVGLFHYSKGSLERAVDIAQEHLDFFAIRSGPTCRKCSKKAT